jgi:hypothetical protein
MAGERPHPEPHKWLKRFGWLIGIWTVSVLALAAAAYAMRLLMNLVGLSTS